MTLPARVPVFTSFLYRRQPERSLFLGMAGWGLLGMSESDRTTTWVPLILVVVLAFAGVLFTMFSPEGLLQWYRLRKEVVKLSAENDQLRQVNEQLRAESRRLATDRKEIERTIRTEMGYVKSDELVFKFAPATAATSKVRR